MLQILSKMDEIFDTKAWKQKNLAELERVFRENHYNVMALQGPPCLSYSSDDPHSSDFDYDFIAPVDRLNLVMEVCNLGGEQRSGRVLAWRGIELEFPKLDSMSCNKSFIIPIEVLRKKERENRYFILTATQVVACMFNNFSFPSRGAEKDLLADASMICAQQSVNLSQVKRSLEDGAGKELFDAKQQYFESLRS